MKNIDLLIHYNNKSLCLLDINIYAEVKRM